MLLEGLVLGLAWGWARGGRLAGFLRLELRSPWLFWVALAVQEAGVAAILRGWWPAHGFWVVQAGSLGLLGIGLWQNRHLPGMAWLVAGVLANAAVIAWFGGRMPVSADALAAAGLAQYGDALAAGTARKHLLVADWHPALWLGDIIPLRPPYYPLRRVASPGDLLQMLGLARMAAAHMLLLANSRGTGGVPGSAHCEVRNRQGDCTGEGVSV